MVVILLLSPTPPTCTKNGCDGGTKDDEEEEKSGRGRSRGRGSSSVSTASTGDTTIPNVSYKLPTHTGRMGMQQHGSDSIQNLSFRNSSQMFNGCSNNSTEPNWNYYIETKPSTASFNYNKINAKHPPPAAAAAAASSLPKTQPSILQPFYYYRQLPQAPPQLSQSSTSQHWSQQQHYATPYCVVVANPVPKPPRRKQQPTSPPPPSSSQPPPQSSLPYLPADVNIYNQRCSNVPPPCPPTTNTNSNTFTTTNSIDFVRHVTRVNFYDIDTSQVEYEPRDDDDDNEDNEDENCDTEAITKEEEWITKRKTELTTTRQIQTRVKRQVLLEDGKVVEDSGPIVSTNTTEDTDKQETETTEKRDLGIPQAEGDTNAAAIAAGEEQMLSGGMGELAASGVGGGKLSKKMVVRPADGLVRESNDKRVISHEEVRDYLATEDVHHMGDFADETYVNAINSGATNLQEVLLSPESQQQLVPLGPRVISKTTKSHKTIDSEDIEKRCLAQADGKLITESKKTTEHAVIVDKDLPNKDDHSTGSKEKIATVEASQRFFKQRDEQNVDLIVDGKVVSTEMRYAAETMQVEKDGSLERPGDWDSLSDRMRKLRRPQAKTLLQQQKEAALLAADRKDALTKRPLDFDREEETRKGETMKWLESHFGSESTASNDSREDDADIIEPTKKTYFNVTIKSNQAAQTATLTNGQKATATTTTATTTTTAAATAAAHDKKYAKEQVIPGRSKYYQGISNWAERKENAMTTNHFATKAFRDDLQRTVERNNQKKVSNNNSLYTSRDKLNETRHFTEPSGSLNQSRENVNSSQQKRQSLSSQFLAKSRQNSRDKLDDLESARTPRQREGTRIKSATGSRTDVRYGAIMHDDNKRLFPRMDSDNGERSQLSFAESDIRKNEYTNSNKVLELNGLRGMNNNKLTPRQRSPSPTEAVYIQRPTVPQRRRAIEKKLRQQSSVPLNAKTILAEQSDLAEPPPDYSPPPRSRSSSPQIDYIMQPQRHKEALASKQLHATTKISNNPSTLTKKHNQRTRFAPTPPTPSTTYHTTSNQQPLQMRPPMMTTQTTQTTPSTISTSTAASHKSSKVGQAIGNSLRKLVSKIRSASAERKLRMKSKSKSREQSPSPPTMDKQGNIASGSTTYQQYNVIDGHIGCQPGSNESDEHEDNPRLISHKADSSYYSNSTMLDHGNRQVFNRASSIDPFVNDGGGGGAGPESELTNLNPRQRYYLGEDPYSSTMYGKDIYDAETLRKRQADAAFRTRNERDPISQKHENGELSNQRHVSSHTLGRYQKSSHRLAGSTPNLNQDYRTVQTLPRKLNDHSSHTQTQYQRTPQRFTANNGHLDKRAPYQMAATTTTTQNAGPAKPARSYAKVLNRSKSFNVHGLNGSNDPSPIYIEKLSRNNYTNNLQTSQAYKSNPHLYSGTVKDSASLLQSGLKSPSIVNLISRSQKDMSKIGVNDGDDATSHYGRQHQQRDDKKQIFLMGLNQQAPDLFRTLHGDELSGGKLSSSNRYQLQHSLASRTPTVELNKDTASIDYVTSSSYNYGKISELAQNKRIHMYKDEQRRPVATRSTIIEVRK